MIFLQTTLHSIPDLLRTFTEHVVDKLVEACKTAQTSVDIGNIDTRILVTGGGAFNNFLMERFKMKLKDTSCRIEETDNKTVEFKEALIFAFLGILCLQDKENVLCSVTGSQRNSISGCIHKPGGPKEEK